MSREVSRRRGHVQVGPSVTKLKTPAGAIGLIVFLVIDSAKWHLLHHLLGGAATVIGWVLLLGAVCWVVRWMRGKR